LVESFPSNLIGAMLSKYLSIAFPWLKFLYVMKVPALRLRCA
jgi:hypothetical protein